MVLVMNTWLVGFDYSPSRQGILWAISQYLVHRFSEMRKDIWKELRLNLCRNCGTRSEPDFNPEPEICPLCGWIMVNTGLGDFKQDGPQMTGPAALRHKKIN